MIKVHGLRRNVKNVVKNYSDAQKKVREATSNDPWGPSGTLMSEIADLSYNVVAFSEIMQVLWKRLNDHGRNWKHVYKALVLLEYLLKTGSERVAQQCKENIFVIETLKDFHHIEENKDQGVNIREKAKILVALLKDEERLKNERVRALKARERFAQSVSHVRKEFLDRKYSSECRERRASCDENALSAGGGAVFVSDLERVRPQTAGEEELQFQLALAISKEEANQVEQQKRNDDLRLQMALSESKGIYEQNQKEKKKPSTAVDDLKDVFVENELPSCATSDRNDPWGVIVSGTKKNLANSMSIDFGMSAERNSDKLSSELKNSESDPTGHFEELLNFSDNSAGTSSSGSCYDFCGMKTSLSGTEEDNSKEGSTAKKFLGENANLVNLDSLIENRSHGNPFQPAKQCQPSINELRAQDSAFTSSTLPKPVLHPTVVAAAKANTTLNRAFMKPSNNPFL